MLTAISSIPTNVREGFDVQDLPLHASTVSEDTLENVFGGQPCLWLRCRTNIDCVRSGIRCRQCIKRPHARFGVCGYR